MEDKNLKVQENESINSLTLLEVITIILNNKKKILWTTGIICLISIVLYFFVFDLIYLSTASIKSSNKGGGLLGSLSENIPDLSDIGDIGIGGGKSSKELASYEEILQSRLCLEELIVKFGLLERDDYKYLEDAIEDFRKNKLTISQEKLAGVMYIGVYDKNPIFAKEMVEFLLQKLDKINIELSTTDAKNNREFIEKRYYQAKTDLALAEDSLKAFQMIYGIAPDLQIKAAAQSVFTLEAELKAEEVKLDVVKKLLSTDQPEVKLQEAKVNSLKSKITDINVSTDLNDFLRLGNSPQIALAFLRLQRDMEIQNKILAFILPLYEQAKIEEKRETPTILVLDKPFVAERKKKPKRLTMVVIWTFVGFIFSSLFFIIKNRVNSFYGRIEKK